MVTNKNLSHINTLKDLKVAQRLAASEIDEAENRLEHLFSALPMKALGNLAGFVASAIVKGFQGSGSYEKNRENLESEPSENNNFGQTLKSVGQETALFAVSKLIEKFVANR